MCHAGRIVGLSWWRLSGTVSDVTASDSLSPVVEEADENIVEVKATRQQLLAAQDARERQAQNTVRQRSDVGGTHRVVSP